MSDPAFTIGEVAAMLGISPHTIRAWERRHVVVRPRRTASGQRRYTADDVELLRQIKHERHVHGLSMRIATMAAQGLVVPDRGDAGADGERPLADAGGDPLRLVADLVPELVVVVDAGGRIAHANTAFVRFCDVLPGQLRGQPFADFADPFDRAKAVLTYRTPLRQRRDWELNLRTRRRRALYAFDCWPVPAPDGGLMVLVGRDLAARPLPPPPPDGRAPIPPPIVDPGTARTRPGVPGPLRMLLDGVADPLRTLGLLGRWLDATPFGVVLTRADAELTVAFANRVFTRWAAQGGRPVVGRSWAELQPGPGRDRVMAAAVEAIRSAQPRSVSGPRPLGDAPPAVVWDVEIAPVTEVGGAVTHVLLVVADVTAEADAARSLQALAACTPALREAGGTRQLLSEAARHARTLLPNAGSLLAAPDASREAVGVVAGWGTWARMEEGGEQRLRLALVRDVIRTGASIEVQRAGAAQAVETIRIVPLAPGRREALGALAFSRLGAATFSADDRQLIDEFAGRVGLALGRAQLLTPSRTSA
ncbi:MAG TPA: PAS domain-containing protein [Candidatus Dormibacteraeota bacterium]|nr:PAS domain-containing protein [Candidatus Dormibacteraeota bacterium]